MKKIVSSLLVLCATSALFAQEALKKGDLVYGTLTDGNGPLSGFVVTERNGHDRIMAQTTTDENGNFSFRIVNPENTILISHMGYQTIIVPIKSNQIDLEMKHQGLEPILILDGPEYYLDGIIVGTEVYQPLAGEVPPFPFVFGHKSYELSSFPLNLYAWESINTEIGRQHSITEYNSIPGKGLYIPSDDHATYYSIDEFYDNWLFPIKASF